MPNAKRPTAHLKLDLHINLAFRTCGEDLDRDDVSLYLGHIAARAQEESVDVA
jgi:hypothetical protein